MVHCFPWVAKKSLRNIPMSQVAEYAPPQEYKSTPQQYLQTLPPQVQAFLIFNNQCLHYQEPKFMVLESGYEQGDKPLIEYPDLPPLVEAARSIGCRMMGKWWRGDLKLG
jgi:hypothetical protein